MASGFNKKGNVISDILLIVIIFFVFCITVFVGAKLSGDLNTEIQQDNLMNNESKELSNDLATRYPSFMDGLIMFILILLWILVLVASFQIDAHPIFFAVTIILFIFVMIVVVEIGNTFEELTNDADLVEYRDQFPLTVWLFDNIIIVSLIFGASVMLVLYGKLRLG